MTRTHTYFLGVVFGYSFAVLAAHTHPHRLGHPTQPARPVAQAADRGFARPNLRPVARGVAGRAVPAPAHSPVQVPEPSQAQWRKLRECESGDLYDNRQNPSHRGGYQIGFGEWAEYGGTGHDPADASPAEQDSVALRLWLARGWEPWNASKACWGPR